MSWRFVLVLWHGNGKLDGEDVKILRARLDLDIIGLVLLLHRQY